MNTTIAAEVREFLTAVTAQLDDVPKDERHEILDGLEADLNDLVAEQGPQALGDPKAYARELRLAAGLAETRKKRNRRPLRESAMAFLDGMHARFDALVTRVPGDVRPIVQWLQPLWWVVRAWAAVQLLVITRATDGIVPTLGGFGWLLLVAAIVASVLLGLGRLWPGGKRGLSARLIMIGLNCVAVAVTITAPSEIANHKWMKAFDDGYTTASLDAGEGSVNGGAPISEQAGIYANGKWISNIYPYTADGKPMVGVQLFDQDGKPINIVAATECVHPEDPDANGKPSTERFSVQDVRNDNASCADFNDGSPLKANVYYPWTNGATQLFNVFPLTSRMQLDLAPSTTAFGEKNPPSIGAFPLLNVTTISLPGVQTGAVAAAPE